MDTIGIGLVGYGMIGKVHALAYHDIPVMYPSFGPRIKLAAMCTTRESSAQSAARDGGFESWTTSIADLVSRDDVHVIDVCVPNFSHHEIILAALRAGKHVIVDKPLARNAAESEEIAKAVSEGKGKLGMVFNYRFVPALMLAQKLIADGALGRIFHFHMDYLHTGYQSPSRAMSWRLRHSQSGGGALVDLGSHVIDMARFLLGEFADVKASTKTYIQERPKSAGSAEMERVDVDDAAWLHATMQNGAQGTLFVTRYATGAVDDMNVHIYGERGSLKFSLQDGNVLNYFNAEDKSATQGWSRIQTGSEFQGAVVPPPRSILGWNRTHTENIYRILHAIAHQQPITPDVTDGLRVHQIIDSAYLNAASNS